MKSVSIVTAIFMILVAATNGFGVPSVSTLGRSSFVAQSSQPIARNPTYQKNNLEMMGGKMAKFGIFSPAVYAAKAVLGTAELNKIRGKAISLHSQAIGDFCTWAGAYHLRTRIIKKAKTNGDILGFLV
mmetsp:Transcript_17349/g.26293  ORF Transcript_17349/g.26293 Transcript_17349/m.26293 type:complete len:129 (+) Transcript_17349:147-533(+)